MSTISVKVMQIPGRSVVVEVPIGSTVRDVLRAANQKFDCFLTTTKSTVYKFYMDHDLVSDEDIVNHDTTIVYSRDGSRAAALGFPVIEIPIDGNALWGERISH